MFKNRKVLKILSIIQFVLSLVVIFLAFLSKAGGEQAVQGGDWGNMIRLYLDLGAYAVFGFLSIAAAVTGIHGANRPSALGSHRLLCILGAITGVFAIIVAGIDEGLPVFPVLTVIDDIAGAVYDGKIRKELDERS